MKKIKTYSIDGKIYDEFDKLSKNLNLNKSSFIENKIEEFLNATKNRDQKKNMEKNLSYESKFRIVEKQFEDRTEFHPEISFIEKEVSDRIGGKNFENDWHSVIFLNGNQNVEDIKNGCKTKEEAEKMIKDCKARWENHKKSQILTNEIIHEI